MDTHGAPPSTAQHGAVTDQLSGGEHEVTTVCRYKSGPRKLMSWREPKFKLAVTLAWYFFQLGGVRNAAALHGAVVDAYPEVSEAVLGRRIDWDELCGDADRQFGCAITPARLHQRADKSARYAEHTEMREAVRQYLKRR